MPLKTGFAKAYATVLGIGYSPVAPGTCGTAAAVPLAWAMAGLPTWAFLVAVAAITAVAIWAAEVADHAWGTHDSGRVVADELAGYLTTMALVDRGSGVALAVGFVVFRALDILKPPPIRRVEDLPGGYGVILDDTAAGVIGAAIMVALDRGGALAAISSALS